MPLPYQPAKQNTQKRFNRNNKDAHHHQALQLMQSRSPARSAQLLLSFRAKRATASPCGCISLWRTTSTDASARPLVFRCRFPAPNALHTNMHQIESHTKRTLEGRFSRSLLNCFQLAKEKPVPIRIENNLPTCTSANGKRSKRKQHTTATAQT